MNFNNLMQKALSKTLWICRNSKHLQMTKLNVIQKLKFIFERSENIVGKGENAGYQHFLLFPPCFQKVYLSRLLKVGSVW